MSSAAVVFVLEEVHRRLTSKNPDGETAEWGVMVAFGPGVTVEIMVLRATTNLEEK